jgi:protein-ribulosamine 3-kinase
MIPPEIIRHVDEIIFQKKERRLRIVRQSAVGGGCINSSWCLETEQERFFLKWNEANKYPGMFEAEARGLLLLDQHRSVFVPSVLGAGAAGGYSFLLLEWIEKGSRKKNFWRNFGKSLASLHRHSGDMFGLDHDNYIGSLKQFNSRQSTWQEFFISQRIEPQLKQAIDNHQINPASSKQFTKLFERLPEIIPHEKPSLLHGDLWNGNFLCDTNGNAFLVDPAVYYGHREMDLAMTKLFGGFDEEFYQGYEEEFPLVKGFKTRIDIHNLYPLLVHVNLFGGGYAEQVERILSSF